MKKTKAFGHTDFDPAEASQGDSHGRMGQLATLPARFHSKARTAAAIWKKQIIALIAVLMSVALFSGCQGSNQSEPSVKQASEYLSSLTKYDIPVVGSTETISANKSGTLYVLARRADLKQAKPAQCKVNGQSMQRSSSNLNYPAGNGQNFFPFAQIDIKKGNSHKLSCNQPDGVEMIALLDPHVRSLPKQAA
ncbi:hypothetical protein [Bifidobacterium mizhiense]|uniref:hypothetical protein n=1 Tax=Bifidobacterium mizhiense TaxID=2879940 RepID=UPI001E61508C|nr:hypothetical protein [Bifidobacterium mizhiense]